MDLELESLKKSLETVTNERTALDMAYLDAIRAHMKTKVDLVSTQNEVIRLTAAISGLQDELHKLKHKNDAAVVEADAAPLDVA